MHVHHLYHFQQFIQTLSNRIMKSYGISIKDESEESERVVVKGTGAGDKQSRV